jgi:hypothetical protein
MCGKYAVLIQNRKFAAEIGKLLDRLWNVPRALPRPGLLRPIRGEIPLVPRAFPPEMVVAGVVVEFART